MKKFFLVLLAALLLMPSVLAFAEETTREVSIYLYSDYDNCTINVSWENTESTAAVVIKDYSGKTVSASPDNSVSYPGGIIIKAGKIERGRLTAQVTGDNLGTIFINGGSEAVAAAENIITAFSAEDSASTVDFKWSVKSENDKISLRIGYYTNSSGNINYVFSDYSAEKNGSASVLKRNLDTGLYNFVVSVNDSGFYTLSCDKTMYIESENAAEKLENVQVGCIDGEMYASWNVRPNCSYMVMLYDYETSNLLERQQVYDSFYSFKLPEGSDKVKFAVAEYSYGDCGKFDVYDVSGSVPGGNIVFPEYSLTEKTIVPVKMDCPNGVTAGVYVDGTLILQDASSGDYSLKLSEGQHEITAFLKDSNGSMKTFSKAITVDCTPPEITLNYSGDVKVNAQSIIVEGRTEPNSIVSVNGVEQTVLDGNFSVKLELKSGINPITVCAYDRAGNKSVSTFNVSSSKEADTNVIEILIVCVPLAVVLAVLYIFINKKAKEGEHK